MEIKDKMMVSPCTDARHNVCLPNETIKEIAKTVGISVGAKVTRKDAVGKLKKKTGCSTEKCVVTKVKPNDTEAIRFFKIKGPRDTTELLSNFEIDDVIENWGEVLGIRNYNVGYQMIDFYQTKSQLATIDLVKLIREGYKTMSVVLNTDKSSGGGIHWFTIFADFRKPVITLEFFNSSGRLPLDPIKKWLQDTAQHLTRSGYKVKIEIVTKNIQHQRSNTECGPYSMYYIWSRLHNTPIPKFYDRIPDTEMLRFRKVLFANTADSDLQQKKVGEGEKGNRSILAKQMAYYKSVQ